MRTMLYTVYCMMVTWCCAAEREAEVLKPLASVEVVEKDQATFDTEISEDDIVGEWKLGGQVLSRTPVTLLLHTVSLQIHCILDPFIHLFIYHLIYHRYEHSYD